MGIPDPTAPETKDGGRMKDEVHPSSFILDPSGARSPAWKWWVCGLLLLATMINYMDRLTINQTAKRIKDEVRINNEQYGEIERAFGVAFALGSLAFGWTVDRWNVRWVYPAALLGW